MTSARTGEKKTPRKICLKSYKYAHFLPRIADDMPVAQTTGKFLEVAIH